MDEDCFVSLVVITKKCDKSVKIALDSRKLNDRCIRKRPHMPNMEVLLNQISVKITRDRTAQLFISKIDLDYTYGQMKLSEETSRHCVFAITGGHHPAITSTPPWLDGINLVTRGNKQEHEKKTIRYSEQTGKSRIPRE